MSSLGKASFSDLSEGFSDPDSHVNIPVKMPAITITSSSIPLSINPYSPSNQARQRSKTVNNNQSSAQAATKLNRSNRSKSTTQLDHQHQLDYDTAFLTYLEPSPVYPPDYSTLPPGKPKPVYPNTNEGKELLPFYEPTVYKIATLTRKLEWLSPYEISPQRQWKNVIVELNSTQLNIYNNESTSKHASLASSRTQSHSSLQMYNINSQPQPSQQKNLSKFFKSRLTSDNDLQIRADFEQRGLISPYNLIKSYSLQYAKVGIAIDYKKRNNILRLRAETEQFLLDFTTPELMIEWYSSLCLGIDNSLDLNKREMPKYRTVPRRRRRYNGNNSDAVLMIHGGNGHQHHKLPHVPHPHHRPSLDNIFKKRTNSSPDLTGIMSKLKSKFSRSSSSTSIQKDSNSITTEISNARQNGRGSLSNVMFTTGGTSTGNSSVNLGELGMGMEPLSVSRSLSETSRDESGLDALARIQLSNAGVEVHPAQDLVGEQNIGENDDVDDDDDDDDDGVITDGDDESLSSENLEAINFQHRDSYRLSGGCRLPTMPTTPELEQTAVMNSESITSTPTSTLSMHASNESSSATTATSSDARASFDGAAAYLFSSTDADSLDVKPIYAFELNGKPPTQRKILRDSLRCMVTLTSNERWSGRFVVRDALGTIGMPVVPNQSLSNHKRQTASSLGLSYTLPDTTERQEKEQAVSPSASTSITYTFSNFSSSLTQSSVGSNTPGGNGGRHKYDYQNISGCSYREFRPLQEFVVTPCGLIPKINEGN